MSAFLRKYGTGTGADISIPLVKRGVVDFAVGADYTPVAGDVRISKDGGASANIATLPVVVSMGNTAMWKFVFSDAELQAASISVCIADSPTKAVEDQMLAIETYGNASAQHLFDLDAAGLTETNIRTAVGLGAANLDTQLSAIEGQTDDIGTTGAGLTTIPWNPAWDSEMPSSDWSADERTAIRTILGVPVAGTTPEVPAAGALKVIDDLVDGLENTIGAAGAGLSALGDTRLANLDAAVSSRSMYAGGAVASVTGNVGGNVVGSVASVTGLTAADVGAIKLKTDNLPATPASVADVPSAATLVSAIKADTEWKTILAGVEGDWTLTPPASYPGTGTLVLKDKAGAVTLATLTLSFNASQVITSRAVA